MFPSYESVALPESSNLTCVHFESEFETVMFVSSGNFSQDSGVNDKSASDPDWEPALKLFSFSQSKREILSLIRASRETTRREWQLQLFRIVFRGHRKVRDRVTSRYGRARAKFNLPARNVSAVCNRQVSDFPLEELRRANSGASVPPAFRGAEFRPKRRMVGMPEIARQFGF